MRPARPVGIKRLETCPTPLLLRLDTTQLLPMQPRATLDTIQLGDRVRYRCAQSSSSTPASIGSTYVIEHSLLGVRGRRGSAGLDGGVET